MKPSILVTLGPSSLSEGVVRRISAEKSVQLLRINLSHTPLKGLEATIKRILKWTDIPICIDSEGAQIRNGPMVSEDVYFLKGSRVKIHFNGIQGDASNISFTPDGIAGYFVAGDRINVDFDSVSFRVMERKNSHLVAEVEQSGVVGSRKAADLDREVDLEPITQKDEEAIKIGKRLGIKHFALSFSNCRSDVEKMRELVGPESTLICKIESDQGVRNLAGILDSADQILIDRGDLSRQVPIEKIPFIQRRIVSLARHRKRPVFVATNLLESMVRKREPTRAEVNDVVSTLLMGANGLVLAAETAIGKFPVEAVKMTKRIIEQFERWTPNTSITEILED